MNKQELIDILENLECSTESLSYDNGYEQGVYDSLSHVILLDEPKKVVVPKFVAEWISVCKSKNKDLSYAIHAPFLRDFLLERFGDDDSRVRWLQTNDNQNILARAWLDGYEVEKEPTIHELKILPEYFEAVVSGDKCFEIRKNDRGYKVGDILRLNEYEDGKYTGNFHVAEITYITDYAQQDGYVVLGIK
ncbi:DUF3850 domain-containing protein [Enterococcus faecalis]|nr:DUF3850 domain-containing protein [Enterococcus faecalis]